MHLSTRRALTAGLLVLALASTGCIGVRSNKDIFKRDPQAGMTEADMLRAYGAPKFLSTVGSQTIYVYRVVDMIYVVLFGISDGYDLVVTCEDGEVQEVRKIRGEVNMAVLQPNPWQSGY